MCREILDGERKPTASNGNNGGMDMMVDDKRVKVLFVYFIEAFSISVMSSGFKSIYPAG